MGKNKVTRIEKYRVFIEHANGMTTLRSVVTGCDIARVRMQGTGPEAIEAGLDLLRKDTLAAIEHAFENAWIPSTGLVGPRPYRTPEVAANEEMQFRNARGYKL